MKAREWFVRGNETTDPVEAFANYWRGFNNLYFAVGNGIERDKIRLILSQSISLAQADEMLQANASGISYLLSQPVIDMRGNGKDTTLYIHAFEVATDALAKLKEVFMVIYQVRCNLEHGQKSPSSERDIQLCQYASPLVAQVVDLNT